MTLISTWYLVNNQEFRGRIAAAIYKSCENILNEGSDPSTKRMKMAEMIKYDPTGKIDWFIWPVASNSTVSAAAANGQDQVPDGDIEYIVASVWDSIAEMQINAPINSADPVYVPPGPMPVAAPTTVVVQ